MFIDARIPVIFAVPPQPDDALLLPGGLDMGHPQGCACCLVRGPAAAAFDRLFLDRVHGRVPWFSRVVVPHDDPVVRATVADDAVVSTRFRLA